MDSYLRLRLLTWLLQSEGALSYRFLAEQFDLDDDTLEALTVELVELRGIARVVPGKGLVWSGTNDAAAAADSAQPGVRPAVTGPSKSAVAPIAQAAFPPGEPPAVDPAQPEAERRHLTVMFCDLVGSTALSTKMDPEDLRDVIAQFQDLCAEVIRRYDGYVARYMGDGILVYFGYPRAHEDDAERAARAGLDIVATLPGLNAQVGRGEAVQLQVRVGVATGAVVVGDLVGEGASAEAAVVGETPNLAARLQGVAKPDQLIVSEATRNLLEERFELEDAGAHELKGLAAPVRAWRVLGAREQESAARVGPPSGRVPLVGREEELGLLHRAWQTSKTGRGQAVYVQGEPGVGKSRLLEALRESIAVEDYTWVSLRCSPYHTNSALHPLIEHLKRVVGWQPDDGDAQRLEKLEIALRRQSLPVEDVIPLFAELLSLDLPDGRYRALDLNPKQRRDATLDAVVSWLQDEAERRPVLQVCEDLHWADPTTLELIGLFVEQSPTSAMLNVLTFRPEFTPPWPTHSHVLPITLDRLEHAGVESMVGHLAGGKMLPPEVLAHIVEKADGVPLYVEEITKAILAAQILEEQEERYVLNGDLTQMQIPSSLQDSLMARLDRVPTVREVAQLGAVLGREFAFQMLRALVRIADEELQRGLRQLVDDELLYQRGRGRRARYIFKHALIQDVAYHSLLKRTRQRYHQQVAALLDEQFPEISTAQPELVAHHYTQAKMPDRAAPRWLAAGRHAIARSSNLEAIAHLNQGLAVLGEVPPGRDTSSLELDFQISLGSARTAAFGYSSEETEQAYLRARALLREVGDDERQFPVLHGMCMLYWNRAQFARNLEVAEEMLQRAAAKDEVLPNLVAHRVLAVVLNPMGRFEQALAHADRAAALYDPERHRHTAHQFGHDMGVGAYWHLSIARLFLGHLEASRDASDRASALARELENDNTTAYDRLWATFTRILWGDPSGARATASLMIDEAETRSMQLWGVFGRHLLGCALALEGEPAAALEEIQRGREEAARLSHSVLKPMTLLFEAHANADLGRPEAALELVQAAHESASSTGERWWMAEIQRAEGTLGRRGGRTSSQVEVCFERALSTAREQHARLLELRAATDLARLWRDLGQSSDAQALLDPVLGGFGTHLQSPDLTAAREVLESVSLDGVRSAR